MTYETKMALMVAGGVLGTALVAYFGLGAAFFYIALGNKKRPDPTIPCKDSLFERNADNENLKTSGALGAFKDLVYQFMGIGAENKYIMDVTKGQWESDLPHQYLRKSTLTTADLTKDAAITEANGQYTIVLNVKGGNSKASKSESWTKAPVDKCGICVGDADKSYFDHKTAPVIYSAVGQVVKGAVISESYNNAVVKAVIDGATGHLVSLTVEFDISVVIDAAGGGNATGTTHVFYKNFKY